MEWETLGLTVLPLLAIRWHCWPKIACLVFRRLEIDLKLVSGHPLDSFSGSWNGHEKFFKYWVFKLPEQF